MSFGFKKVSTKNYHIAHYLNNFIIRIKVNFMIESVCDKMEYGAKRLG
jgi:hypothetical protein